eukprot:COSAG01_NODE_3135_length_6528_cov_7.013841_7_plen_120_part_00
MPEQIKAQSKSILKTQRDIVYSLSPGSGMSATMDKAKEIHSVVNMYRVTGDDWDSWKALQGHFGVAAWAANQSLMGAAGLRGRSWPGERRVLSLSLSLLVAWIQTHGCALLPCLAPRRA